MLRNLALTALVGIAGMAAAQGTFSVDSAGGPLTLPEEVEAAFLKWADAGVKEIPEEAEQADTAFRFGSVDLLGPDTVTLTLQRSESTPGLEIIVHPELYRDFPGALLHETGLALGLTAGSQGVMRPALAAGAEPEVTAADAASVVSALAAVRGDLTGDGVVDFRDLLELAEQFGQRGINLPADLDGDGVVTMDDLVELRTLYEFLPPGEPVPEAPAAEPEAQP